MTDKKYKITYIEDEPAVFDDFARESHKIFEIVELKLLDDIEDMIREIITSKVDAVVADYTLRNHLRNYNGSDIIFRLNELTPELPTFVLTGHIYNAEEATTDVNKVYSKFDYFSKNGVKKGSETLNNRIQMQIKHYHDRITAYKNELSQLRLKQESGKLSLAEEERLIELDGKLETLTYHVQKYPKTLKETTNIEKLNELILETRLLIDRIDRRA